MMTPGGWLHRLLGLRGTVHRCGVRRSAVWHQEFGRDAQIAPVPRRATPEGARYARLPAGLYYIRQQIPAMQVNKTG